MVRSIRPVKPTYLWGTQYYGPSPDVFDLTQIFSIPAFMIEAVAGRIAISA
jgi:hypothetical protein